MAMMGQVPGTDAISTPLLLPRLVSALRQPLSSPFLARSAQVCSCEQLHDATKWQNSGLGTTDQTATDLLLWGFNEGSFPEAS